MTDFDDRMKTLLNEHVDALTGPQRPAPSRRATSPAAHRARTRWLPPLLAAAVIAVAVGGTVAGVQLLSTGPHPAGPATELPQPSVATAALGTTAPAPSAARTTPRPTTPSQRSSSSPPRTTHTTGHAERTTPTPTPSPLTSVPVSASLIVLPAGWEVRDMQQYMTRGSASVFDQCLTPKRLPVSTKDDACPVMLAGPIEKTSDLAPDTEGGFVSDPHPCGQFEKSVSTKSGHRDFGGRRASWHHWIHRCEKRADVLVEQYVVTSKPGYVLYSDQATPEIVAAMTTIAKNSQLAT